MKYRSPSFFYDAVQHVLAAVLLWHFHVWLEVSPHAVQDFLAAVLLWHFHVWLEVSPRAVQHMQSYCCLLWHWLEVSPRDAVQHFLAAV